MKNLKKSIIYIVIMSLILLTCTGCSLKKTEENKSKDKTLAEVNYIEDSLIKIINKYAKGEYSKEETVQNGTETVTTIEWDSMLKDEKDLLESLDTVILDLSELDIKNEDVIKLSSEINNLIILTTEENISGVLYKIRDIYSLIPEYMKTFENDTDLINKKNIKRLVISCYSLVVDGKWEEAKAEALNLETKYKEMMNDLKYAENNSYNLNNIYVLVEEFKNSIGIENIELVSLKYITLIEKI